MFDRFSLPRRWASSFDLDRLGSVVNVVDSSSLVVQHHRRPCRRPSSVWSSEIGTGREMNDGRWSIDRCSHINVMENIPKDFFFRDDGFTTVFVDMRTGMDNSIHVQVEVIEIRNLQNEQVEISPFFDRLQGMNQPDCLWSLGWCSDIARISIDRISVYPCLASVRINLLSDFRDDWYGQCSYLK